MSAFVVAPEHIHVLLKAGLSVTGIHAPVRWHTGNTRGLSIEELGQARRELRHETRDDVGLMLLTENVASVRHLYRSDAFGDPEQPVSYEYRDPFYKPTPVEALKAVDCYEYQSCEHPAWRQVRSPPVLQRAEGNHDPSPSRLPRRAVVVDARRPSAQARGLLGTARAPVADLRWLPPVGSHPSHWPLPQADRGGLQ